MTTEQAQQVAPTEQPVAEGWERVLLSGFSCENVDECGYGQGRLVRATWRFQSGIHSDPESGFAFACDKHVPRVGAGAAPIVVLPPLDYPYWLSVEDNL